MDVDVAVHVRLTEARIHDVLLIVLLCALAAEFQHRAHGSVAVDIGVFTLNIGLLGILEHDVAEGAHQPGIHFTNAAALGAIKNVRLCGARETVSHQHLLDRVLYLLDAGNGADILVVLQLLDDLVSQLAARFVTARTAGRLK